MWHILQSIESYLFKYITCDSLLFFNLCDTQLDNLFTALGPRPPQAYTNTTNYREQVLFGMETSGSFGISAIIIIIVVFFIIIIIVLFFK